MKQADLSVVVPSFRSSATIQRCLDSILASIPPGREVELIVADSSDDGSERIIQAYAPRVLLLHRDERMLPGKARNLGIEATTAERIVFVDADCIVPNDWCDRILAVFRDSPEVDAFVGSIRNANPGLFSWLAFVSEFTGYLGRVKGRKMESLPTYCAAFRRELFDLYGGFPEDIWPGEDAMFSRRLRDAGKTLTLEPSVWVCHHNRDTVRAFFHHQVRLGRAYALSRAHNPDLSGGRALAMSPWTIPLLSGWRTLLALKRLACDQPALLGLIILLLPLYVSGIVCWTIGAWQGRHDEAWTQR